MTHAWLFTGPPGSGRSVAARRYEPSFVRSITYQVLRQTMSDATITQARYFGRNMKPRF
mgnify:CR=1 FL=1